MRQMLLVATLFLAGIVLLVFGVPLVSNSLTSSSWPTTTGVIAISRMSTSSEGGAYGASVVFDYTVGGTTYSSSNVVFGDFSSSDVSHARNVLNKYPLGKRVTVHYDQGDPSTAVLEPGLTWVPVFLVVLGTVMTLAGVAGVIQTARGKNLVIRPATAT